MRSLRQVPIPQFMKKHKDILWPLLFFVTLMLIFFSSDSLITLVPTTQASAVAVYPGDANWDKNFNLGYPDYVSNAVGSDGTNLFVGGRFEFVGSKRLNNIGYWDGTAWQEMDGGIPNTYGNIDTIAVSGDNVYVGGYFPSVGTYPGVPSKNIAVWSKTTKKWSSLQGGVNGSVNSIAANSTDVFVAGYFQSAGGIQTPNLARWNIAQSAWNAFGGLSPSETVNEIATDGQNVYIAGSFTQIGGQPAINAAYWDGTAWHAMDITSYGSIEHLVAKDGRVYLTALLYGGDYLYETIVKSWNGTTWTDLGTGITGFPIDLTLSPDGQPVLVVDNYKSGRREIYRWNEGTGSYDLFIDIPAGSIQRMLFHGTDLVLSGDFQGIGGSCAAKLASWNGSQWSAIGTFTTVNGGVLSVVGPSENELYFGGSFSCASEQQAKLVTQWDGTSLKPVGDGLSGHFARLAWDSVNNRLYAAGSFTADRDPSINGIAYLENGQWQAVGNVFDPLSQDVDAIAVSGDTVVISHPITNVYPVFSQIYSLRNGSWQPLGGPVGGPVGGRVRSLAIIGNEIYAGGDFSKISEYDLNNIARWNGVEWTALGSGTDRPVNTLAAYGNNLLVGGDFTSVNGDPNLAYIARWDGTSWHDLGSLDATGVKKIALNGNNIYAAHKQWGSESTISRWDGTNWSRVAHVSNVRGYGNDLIDDMIIHHGNIFVGGTFASAGENPSNFIGWWHAPTIYGQVRDGTKPLSGVTILTNDGRSTTTDDNGNYVLTGASMGSTFSAIKPGYSFQPAFRSVNDGNIALNITGQYFSGTVSIISPTKPAATATPTAVPLKPAPAVTAISVREGSISLGTEVEIIGTNFQAIPIVKLGEFSLSNVRYIDSSHLKGVLPALPDIGYYPLTVTNPDGQSATLQKAYYQTALIPTIVHISPTYGYNRYANHMNIGGSGFKNGSTIVLINSGGGEQSLTTTYNSTNSLSANIPSQLPKGMYSVRVDNPAPDARASAVIEEGYQSIEGTFDAIYTAPYAIWQQPAALIENTIGKIGITLHRVGGETRAENLKVAFYFDSISPFTKIGEGSFSVLHPDQDASSTPIDWYAPAAGEYTILAVLDPDSSFARAYPGTRLPAGPIQQTITILPKTKDTIAPVINKFTINQEGAQTTSSLAVSLYTAVTDALPSSGVASLYYVESTYSQAADAWSPVRSSGWVPARLNPYSWQLSPRNGIKHLRVWAADSRGNVSQPVDAWINYAPASNTLEMGMTHAYRYHLDTGQQLYATIKANQAGSSGDADLYLWNEGTLLAWSDQPAGKDDTILFTAAQAGMDVQLEVFGYTDAAYSLIVGIQNTPSGASMETLAATTSLKGLPAQPAIQLGAGPVEKVGLPAAPLSATDLLFKFSLPFVGRGSTSTQ